MKNFKFYSKNLIVFLIGMTIFFISTAHVVDIHVLSPEELEMLEGKEQKDTYNDLDEALEELKVEIERVDEILEKQDLDEALEELKAEIEGRN